MLPDYRDHNESNILLAVWLSQSCLIIYHITMRFTMRWSVLWMLLATYSYSWSNRHLCSSYVEHALNLANFLKVKQQSSISD